MPAKRSAATTPLPEGFLYVPDFLSEPEQSELLAEMERLPFKPFDFHGYVARRRIVEYGWEYDFGTRQTTAAAPIPPFLVPVRERTAAVAEVMPQDIVEAVITEYPPGAPIGWHRDVPQFEIIAGVSLGSPCRMRLRPYAADGSIASIILEPRSLYVMRGPARWRYQHSIPPVAQRRYSITFRTLRRRKQPAPLAA